MILVGRREKKRPLEDVDVGVRPTQIKTKRVQQDAVQDYLSARVPDMEFLY
jgi:hypothetical protein